MRRATKMVLHCLLLGMGFLFLGCKSDSSSRGVSGQEGSAFLNKGYSFVAFDSNGEAKAHNLALNSDGAIYAVGNDGFDELAVARFKPNGTLDSTFGNLGRLTLKIPAGPLLGEAQVAVDASGRLLVGGGSYRTFSVARLLNNGSLDAGFGNQGWVTTTWNTTDTIASLGTILVHNSKILLGGGCQIGTGADESVCFARYNDNGQPDSTFGTSGLASLTSGDLFAVMLLRPVGDTGYRYVAVRANGQDRAHGTISASGSFTTPIDLPLAGMATASTPPSFGDVRLSASGDRIISVGQNNFTGGAQYYLAANSASNLSIDTSFGANGIRFWPVNNYYNMSDMDVLPDGRIVLIGSKPSSVDSPNSTIFIRRTNVQGVPDSSIGINGLIEFSPWPGAYLRSSDVLAQPDGKFLVLGWTLDPTSQKFGFVIARFLASGQLDL